MACCTDQAPLQAQITRPTAAMLSHIPESTWCCLGRMAYGLVRAVQRADVPEWFDLPLERREAFAQMLRRALVEGDATHEEEGFNEAAVRAAKVLMHAV